MLIRNHIPALLSLLLLLCVAMSGIAQIEPQFKFYLAFEDAKQEKDTVWLVLDDSAGSSTIEPLFGEDSVSVDSISFGVYLVIPGGIWSKTSAQGVSELPCTEYIYAFNNELPLTMRWDNKLLENHELPFELKQAYAENNNFNEFGLGVIDLFSLDSAVLDTFYEGGGLGTHFPLEVYLSRNPASNNIGLNESLQFEYKVYPVPADKELFIEQSSMGSRRYLMYNKLGQLVRTGYCTESTKRLNVESLPSGPYVLIIQHEENFNYKKIILSH